MSVLSFSVQHAEEQSPTSKGNLRETTLLQLDCPQQREGDKLSLAMLESNQILLEAEQARQVSDNYAENDTVKESNYASPRIRDELPSIVSSAERPVLTGECAEDSTLKEVNYASSRMTDELHNVASAAEIPALHGECSQSLQGCSSKNSHEQNVDSLETDSLLMANYGISNGTSEAKASSLQENLCKQEAGNYWEVQPHSLPHLQCNGKDSYPEQKQEIAPLESVHVCGSNMDGIPNTDSHVNEIIKDKRLDASCGTAASAGNTQDSCVKDHEQFDIFNRSVDLTFQTDLGTCSISEDEHNNEHFLASGYSVQTTEKLETQVQDDNEEGKSVFQGAEYIENHTVALWVKWRGKWQTGFQCPRVDCPLQTLRAKPTHERKNYIAIFFPRKRTYSWADQLLVRSISEFPEPLVSGTHRKWRKLVKDLSTPRRYVMQKLAVAMLNISDQLHTEAVVEVARKAGTWKEFAMEASSCKDYSELGRLLMKLQTMILPMYVSDAWLETSFSSWKQRCQNANSAECVEVLTDELLASVQWSKVDDLWTAPVQPELGPEWNTWKQEALKWFSTLHPAATGTNTRQINQDIFVSMEPQTCGKRPKLEIRRAENHASQMGTSDCRILSQVDRVDTYSGHSGQDITGSMQRDQPLEVRELSEVDAPVNSGIASDRGDEIPDRVRCLELVSSVQTSTSRSVKSSKVAAPYQYRQCLGMSAKGRQCGRWASDGDVYCCVHTSVSSGAKSLMDQRPPPDAPMCEGMTTQGHKCKHRARLGSAFCKKHHQKSDDSMNVNNLITSSGGKLKRKFSEENALEIFSFSSPSNNEKPWLITKYETSTQKKLIPLAIGETMEERNVMAKNSEFQNEIPNPVRATSPDFPRCIGYDDQGNSQQCLENAKKHTLYCEKHIPKFLKRARDGKSRLVSKDVFISLLKNCSSRVQKLHLHKACELLYGFMKRSLSRQKPGFKDNIMDWTLSEASKDEDVGSYLLKLVSCEREKIMRFWGFGTDIDTEAVSSGTNAVSTLVTHEKDGKFEIPVKCKICAAELSDDEMLAVHWTEFHKKEARWLFRGYACAVCMNSFTNRKVLESHVKVRHGVQFLEHSVLFRCMSCNSHFLSPEQLWQHVLSSHLSEFRMADHSRPNHHPMNQPNQPKIEPDGKLCQNNNIPVTDDDSQRYICRFCGLKFDLLPDLGRHHQVAHSNASYINQIRGNHYNKHSKHCHPRFKKSLGGAFRFKKQNSFGLQKRFPTSDLVLSLKPNLKSEVSETMTLGRLSESHCADVAETLFSEMQKTKPRPSNQEILSIARSSCCRISLRAALEAKYGLLPENIFLKAAKICSELNIQISWHREGFICPQGCKPLKDPPPPTSMNAISKGNLNPPSPSSGFANDRKWEMEECHYILDPKLFNWKTTKKTVILCKDVSLGKEPVPVVCVVDEDLDDMPNIRSHELSQCWEPSALMPWQSFTYVTERLLEPSLGLDAKNSQLGCGCPPTMCFPEKCDHVYLFDNDYENAEDVCGKSMCGRFPYDEKGRIVLQEGYLVYECNSSCHCNATCHNRVLQKGIHAKLEIFKTEKKGWAVRAGEAILRGTFVCEYIGEVMNNVEWNEEKRSNNVGSSYIYDINSHFGLRGLGEGTIPLLIDATKFGNVSRFINHSCSPNLASYLVLVESMDCQLAHVGLYASRDIAKGEELAYDYCFELQPGEGTPCHCGAPNCRGRLY